MAGRLHGQTATGRSAKLVNMQSVTNLELYTVNWLIVLAVFAFFHIVLGPRFVRLRGVSRHITHNVLCRFLRGIVPLPCEAEWISSRRVALYVYVGWQLVSEPETQQLT